MSPESKANELVQKMLECNVSMNTAKIQAKIAAREVLDHCTRRENILLDESEFYWQDVINQIDKI